jgi:Tol biopolymer transport system component
VNLTRTPDLDEFYPHVSPDGTKICFLVDEKSGDKKVRNLYLMNLDGSGRTKIADNAREGCWSPDGKKIAYLKGEFDKYTLKDYASKGLAIYDPASGQRQDHPNKDLHHLYNVCWTPDGAWFVSTVHGGMGFRHGILAFEANGTKVFNLNIGGCRPDLSADGKRLGWGASDEKLMVADIDFSGPAPKVTHARPVAHCQKKFETYHIDWAPDGKHVAFSYGPSAGEQIGERAPGWNICVGDLDGKWAPVTTDGKDNKEPDWVPIPAGRGQP